MSITSFLRCFFIEIYRGVFWMWQCFAPTLIDCKPRVSYRSPSQMSPRSVFSADRCLCFRDKYAIGQPIDCTLDFFLARFHSAFLIAFIFIPVILSIQHRKIGANWIPSICAVYRFRNFVLLCNHFYRFILHIRLIFLLILENATLNYYCQRNANNTSRNF